MTYIYHKNNNHNTNKWIGIISIFPRMFNAIINYGITGRAIKNKLIKIRLLNPREFSDDKYHSIDKKPYGGGPGMLMMAKPLLRSIQEAKNIAGTKVKVIYLSPQGKKFNQEAAKKLSLYNKLILVCGRYEGVDERLITCIIDEEWSIGDYVISGGELAAMVLIDTITRLIPGALGDDSSASEDSFYSGLLDYPHYTHPKILNEIRVPPILLSGDHNKIRRWRLKQSLGRTWLRRPELLKNIDFTEEKKKLLDEFKKEYYMS